MSDGTPPPQDADDAWTLEELADEADGLRARLGRLRDGLARFFVGKTAVIDVMITAAVAQEPILLVGPPGTAKSELVTKFRDALGVPESDYFEYMLTRFTEPGEIVGPVDIDALRSGRYTRRITGRLPTAKVVFLDEIFKSNSAILNILLTILNEKKFYQDGVPQPVPLKVFLAATNEVPEHEELAALRDRFVLKAESLPVQEESFDDLIDLGLAAETDRALRRRPWAEGQASLTDLLKANRYLTYLFARRVPTAGGGVKTDRDLFFPPAVMRDYRRIVQTLAREDRIVVSDRKLVKLYKILRTHAWLARGGAVEREDLKLLAYVGETPEQMRRLAEKVPTLLGLA